MNLDKLEKLEVACRILEQGFKDERSMLDDGMIEYAQEVCDEAGTIRALIREHFAMRRALGDILDHGKLTVACQGHESFKAGSVAAFMKWCKEQA